MLRQIVGKLTSQQLPFCKVLTISMFSFFCNINTIKTNSSTNSVFLCLAGCLSVQVNVPSNIGRLLPAGLLTSTLPKVSPTVYNIIGEQNIVGIWKMPEYRPHIILPLIKDDCPLSIENPDLPKVEKQAARMIVIRRRKMKKHKLRKLRKVRKFEYRRMALKRKTQKEKDFKMKLMTQMKEAEKFDAKSYVENLIRIAKEEIVEPPKTRLGFKRNPSLYDEKGNRILLNKHLYQQK